MGKSATTLGIREPPRFNWSLNNKVITKVPNPNWALMQSLPLMLPLALRNEEKNNPCNPQCCSFISRSTKHVDLLHATLHRNYEIHVDKMGHKCTVPNHASHAPFNRMWTYSNATQGSLLFLRHFRNTHVESEIALSRKSVVAN